MPKTGGDFYSARDISDAIGIQISLFNSWISRRHFPLPHGPGTGRAAKYDDLDFIRFAVAATLTRLGVSVSVAAMACARIDEETINSDRDILVIRPSESGVPIVDIVALKDLPFFQKDEQNIPATSKIVVHITLAAIDAIENLKRVRQTAAHDQIVTLHTKSQRIRRDFLGCESH